MNLDDEMTKALRQDAEKLEALTGRIHDERILPVLLLDCGWCEKTYEVSRMMAQEIGVRCPFCGEKNWTGRIYESPR